MTIKKNMNLCMYLLFSLVITVEAFADLGPSNYAFLNLLQNSDLIVAGYVSEVNESPMEIQITFIIERSIKDPLNRENIEISVPLANGLPIPTEAYLQKGKKYILFLTSYGSLFKITNHKAGVMKEDTFSDIDLLFTAFRENNDLFSKASIDDLKRMFRNFSSNETRYRLLIDMRNYLSIEDDLFFTALLESGNEQLIIFSVQQIGIHNINSLRFTVIQLLVGTNSINVQLHCLVALGDMKDIESVDLISSYLNHPDQGIRLAAIQSLGKLGTIEVIGSLQLLYANENDVGNRISIITALERNPNKVESIKALKELQDVQATPLVSSILKKRLSKLE